MDASEFAFALARTNFCPASISYPPHALIAECCNARPYENDTFQGRSGAAIISFRYIDAAYSLRPPDKKLIRATAAGTERNNVLIVYPATFL